MSKVCIGSELMKEQCGTPAYIAPEVVAGNGYTGYASDIWSCGVVLFTMLCGTVPFKGGSIKELKQQISNASYIFKQGISVGT